jgi:hypothetical protein
LFPYVVNALDVVNQVWHAYVAPKTMISTIGCCREAVAMTASNRQDTSRIDGHSAWIDPETKLGRRTFIAQITAYMAHSCALSDKAFRSN